MAQGTKRRRGGRSRSRGGRLQGLRKAVDEGANTAEDIHKRVADLPLELIGQVGPLEEPARSVRDLQDRSIHAIYELVRDINHRVIQLANDVLPAPKPRRKAARARKRPAAKASAASKESAAA